MATFSKHKLFIILEISFLILVTISPLLIIFISTLNQAEGLTSKSSSLLKIGFYYWLLVLLPVIYGLTIEFLYPDKK